MLGCTKITRSLAGINPSVISWCRSTIELVPGVGAQGGSLEEVAANGLNRDCGLLVNSSRGIIYAGKDVDFAVHARSEALKLQKQMDVILQQAGI